MNEEFWRWYMYGHWVCLTQWLGFIMVEYAYLGKGKVKHPLVWSGVITMLTMTLSVVRNYGFFTPMAVALTILFLFITVMLFGGTPGQKFTACLINGTMCLLVENSMRYVISWILKCELQQVIQRADCLIIIAVANMVVGAAVAFWVSKWRRRNALEPLQALTMSFFPGVVVVLNILLMLTDNNKRATMATMGMTVGLTVAVMVHLCIVAMFNDQVMQRRSLYFQAELEQQRASALLDSYTAQRRLTHEFTNHISALRALLEQGDVAGAQNYIAGVDKAVAASTTIMDTHNPLLDSILTRKYEEATRQGVSVYFDLCDLRNFPLSGVDMVTVLANMVVGAAVAFWVSKWRRRNALEPLQALTMSFFPGVVVVLNILLMLTDNNKRATMATMGMTVGLTVAVMVHLCIVAMFNDQVMQRRSLYFQAELEQQRASALLDSYTAQRRLTHEFTNHISALRALLEQGDVAGAQNYIAGVDKAVAASTTIMDTHNPLLDSILTRKYEEATRQGVSVYFDLCDLRNFPLSGVDMVTVLANLLDNAICAAAQAYPPEVYVRVRKTGEEYLLSVRNRVQRDVELPPDGQLPRTTRKEPGHGMGLSNVRDVLLRHGAEYTLSCRDNWFRFTCAVPTDNS